MAEYTHRIKFHYRRTWRSWDCVSEESARQRLAQVMSRGLEHKSPGGAITITPPWMISRIEIKPIVLRGRKAITRIPPAPAPAQG